VILDLILRYALGGRQHGFTLLVARVSLLGMVLGVASLIVVLSVMNGFSSELHRRILSVTPHLTLSVKSPDGALLQEVGDFLANQSEVRSSALFLEDMLLLTHNTQQHVVRMAGLSAAGFSGVTALADHITEGSLEAVSQTAFTVVLGRGVAQRLGVQVGDEVTAVLPTLSITPAGVFPRQRRLRVVAEFEVGSSLDAQQAFVSLDTARRLFARDIDSLQVALYDRDQVKTLIARVANRFGETVDASGWQQSQGSLFTAIRMEKITVAVLLMAVVAVAAFNIVSTLTMSVTEKARDIAVLRVIGMPRSQLMWIFIGYGAVLGGIGIAIGAVLGVGLALHVADIAIFLEQFFGARLFDPSVYYIGRLPSELQWLDVVVTLSVAAVLTLVATLYPAYRAATLHPMEVLHDV
jgi:lipoprotein-releasing system permease protein